MGAANSCQEEAGPYFPTNHLTTALTATNPQTEVNYFFEVGLKKRYVLEVPAGQAYVSRDHNVYKDSCLHPTHYHNVDIS